MDSETVATTASASAVISALVSGFVADRNGVQTLGLSIFMSHRHQHRSLH
jgi:hypothetical protein